MSDQGPIPGGGPLINHIALSEEGAQARIDAWFRERRLEPDSDLFLRDLLSYVTDTFDNMAAHNLFASVTKYADIDATYMPSLQGTLGNVTQIALAYAKHRLKSAQLKPYMLAVRTRLSSRTLEWKSAALRRVREQLASESSALPNQARSGRPRRLVDAEHERHVGLSDRILEKQSLEEWLKANPSISRTQFTDYRAGRIARKISSEKRAAIEHAIRESARKLGLQD